MPESVPAIKKTLAEKLAEACNAIGGIAKKGKNEKHGYSYVRAADVAKALRNQLLKRGIIIIPNEISCEQERFTTHSGGTATEVVLCTEYVISDGSETITAKGYGIARDSYDKAIYKAKTGAQKYFLRGLGLIPDEKDDPEADETIEKGISYEKEFDKRTEGQRSIAEYQVNAFVASCAKHGRTAPQIQQFLATKFGGITQPKDIMRSDFDEAIKWAMNREEMVETLKTSAKAATNGRRKPQPVVQAIDESEPEWIAGD